MREPNKREEQRKRILARAIETLIVLAILVTIVIFLGPSCCDLYILPIPCGSGLEKAKLKRTVADLRNMGEALERFREKHGGYPPGDLAAVGRALVAEGLIFEAPVVDGWKKPFVFAAQQVNSSGWSDAYSLGSLGCDGRVGAGDFEGSKRRYAQDLFLVSGKWAGPAPRVASCGQLLPIPIRRPASRMR